MNKYRRLAANTVIFAIGTFGSKLLVFFLLPFFTTVLTTEELSVSDLIVQTSNLSISVVSLGIFYAVIRFGLERGVSKAGVFTGALTVIGGSYGVFVLCFPLMKLLPINEAVKPYLYLVYLYVIASCLRSLCAQFVRAKELVRLAAFDGILSTAMVLIFNLVFLWGLKMGILGYVLAIVCADFMSALFLFTTANLKRYVKFNRFRWGLVRKMLRYSLPLIPANIFWWIINVSDHYFVTEMVSVSENGLYVVAYKLPTIITLVSAIFTDAWQLSAFTEDRKQRSGFFSKVFESYTAMIFTAASGLLMLTKVMVKVLVSDAFYGAWRYVPFLILAASFSCLVTFFGTLYQAEKRNGRTLWTTALGALMNVVLNLLLIPRFGVNGAAFATFFSFFSVFVIRLIDVQKLVRITFRPVFFGIRLGLLGVQVYLLLAEVPKPLFLWGEIGVCVLMCLLNLRQITLTILRILSTRRGG